MNNSERYLVQACLFDRRSRSTVTLDIQSDQPLTKEQLSQQALDHGYILLTLFNTKLTA